ncbi:unnamed protein product [Cuscuta campestris]|uniref:PHD-type domain-containing protein n=1 Tax=Cuscuta campestris TaxID=132261 RepID=A0A484LX31_9ASTE|nr:unnamed protein product [Cuscuta campestris]
MAGKLQGLPPLKRFILMQKHQENGPDSSNLPAKKRKLGKALQPDSLPSTTCCLPAKKRVWAIQPLDLNVQYNPVIEDEISEKRSSKEVYFSQNQEPGKSAIPDQGMEDDDGIACAICGSTDGDPSDPIVICDGCDLMVHTTCYGHPFSTKGVPEGDWFCSQCLEKPEKPISCSLCPASGGALKPTSDGKWAHLVCALFVPEVFFTDPDGREGIDCSKVPDWRWDNKCYVCKSRKGCALDCSELNCPLAFHVTCGLKQDLCIEYNQGRTKGAIVAGFCRAHTDLWKKQQQTGKFRIVARD